MAKKPIDDLLKRRMSAANQASDLQTSDTAYEKLFRETPPVANVRICAIALDKLTAFFTADIGFKPYTPAQLEAFAGQLMEEGLMVRIIVRPIPGSDSYEILAGHNRTAAARLAGWAEIPAEVVDADDARAIVIATSTNLIQRQNLSIIERGKAYKALLEAKSRQGQRFDLMRRSTSGENRPMSADGTSGENRPMLTDGTSGESRPMLADGTSGENRQRYSARALVAEFFGVTEYEIRKAVKLTYLIPELAEILENTPKQLNLACADLMADYDTDSQQAFVEICSIEGYQINKAAMQHIVRRCPPPTAQKQAVFTAWHEARAAAEERRAAPPKNITFRRKRFEPYLEKLGSDRKLEELFLEFLQERIGA